MKKILIVFLLLAFAASNSGCGTIGGAATGAGLNHRNPWKGAAIGAGIGTVVEGLFSSFVQPRQQIISAPPAYYAPPSAAYLQGRAEAERQRQYQAEQYEYLRGIRDGGGYAPRYGW